jgi:hypothetical protein
MAAFVGTADRSQTVGREMTIPVGAATRLATWENEGGRSAPIATADEQLDWEGFLTRFYPHARKHDYVPLAAYVEFRKSFVPAIPVTNTSQPSERSRP